MRPPEQMGAFEFAKISMLRVAQLARGCTPRVDGDHTKAVFAQREVFEGKVVVAPHATAEQALLPVNGDGTAL